MDVIEFEDWVRSVKAGTKYEYYRGHLGRDRTDEGPLGKIARENLNVLANAIHFEAEWDRVLCYQKRHADFDTSYWVIKTAYNVRFDNGEFTNEQNGISKDHA